MNKYARFDEIPSTTLKDIKETKRYGRMDGQTDNVKTVYPPTNTVCGGYNYGIKLWRPFKQQYSMGRNGHRPKWLWAKMVMDRNGYGPK